MTTTSTQCDAEKTEGHMNLSAMKKCRNGWPLKCQESKYTGISFWLQKAN